MVLHFDLVWSIDVGYRVRIGTYPWVGCEGKHRLPAVMVDGMREEGYIFLAQVVDKKTPLSCDIHGSFKLNTLVLQMRKQFFGQVILMSYGKFMV